MDKQSRTTGVSTRSLPAALMLLALLFPLCSWASGSASGHWNSALSRESETAKRGGEARASRPRTFVSALVKASMGGVFADDPENPIITVTIPAGALSADARLRVRTLRNAPGAGENQTVSSPAFSIKLQALEEDDDDEMGRETQMRQKDDDDDKLALSEPMKIAIATDVAPIHPQIGEIAVRAGRRWMRLQANFYRSGEDTVVGLTTRTRGIFRAVYRTLQTTSGDAVARGLDVFLHETFGNEAFFGDVVGLHELLNEVPPVAAVALGAQVDVTKVPQGIVDVMTGNDLNAKDAALNDPATTRALIKAGAVIGVKGVYATDEPADDMMVGAGITCALCHVNVTPLEFELNAGTVALPIGFPNFDGVPNNDMDAGAILALTPFAQGSGPAVVDLLNSWGTGRFDIRALPDNPLDDGVNNPTAHPPIWNFVDLEEQGYVFGWDGLFANDGVNNNAPASQAEAVYDLVMHGNGAFGTANGTLPPELSIVPPPELLDALAQAETDQPGNDITADELLDVQAWMRSVVSPPPMGFAEAEAEDGFQLFHGKANCTTCHQTAEFTGPGLFTDITENPPTGGLAGGIRVPGLRGVSRTAPHFHDGSAATLRDAVERLVDRGAPVPNLTPEEIDVLVEYLKSL